MFHPRMVKDAVQHNGLLLGALVPELRADREVVLAAVAQNGAALRYASPELGAWFWRR